MDQYVLNAWKTAAKELGISIEVPFELQFDSGEVINDLLLIKDFGGKAGTVIFGMNHERFSEIFKNAEKKEYFCSGLNTEVYKEYNRQIFIETLNDWGYFGEEKDKPDWM